MNTILLVILWVWYVAYYKYHYLDKHKRQNKKRDVKLTKTWNGEENENEKD